MPAAASDIVVVGSLNRDHVLEVATRPVPGETVTAERMTVTAGGKGANQAAAAARVGARVRLIGRIGGDDAGSDLVVELRDAGVDTTDVIVSPSEPTGAAFVTVTPDGENTIIVVSGANSLLGSADLQARRSLLETASVVLLQLEVSDDVIETAIHLAGAQTLVVLNAAPYRKLSRAVRERTDVLVVNKGEASQLLGGDGKLQDQRPFAHVRPRAVVVTLGDAGAHAYVGTGIVECEAPESRVVDTTGAGDAFTGALAAWLAGEATGRSRDLAAPLGRAMEAASVAGAFSVSRVGAQSSYGRREELGPPWT